MYWPARDHPLLEHRPEDLVAAGDGPRGVDERVVRGRRLVEPREQRGLGQGQPARRLREVRPGGCLGPVGEVAVEDRVEVGREDLVLRPGPVELHGEARLGDLPLDRALVRDVEVADELLADRRPALDDPSRLDVPPERPRDPLRVDPAVLVEPPVLDRDRRLAEPGRDLRERHDLPVALGRDHAEKRAVGGIDERVLADLGRPQRGEVAAVAEGQHRGPRRDPGRREKHDDDRDDDRQLPGPARLAAADTRPRRRRSRRARAPGAAHGAMVATVATTSRQRREALCPVRGIVARCAGWEERGRRCGSSSGAGLRSGRSPRAPCSSSSPSSTRTGARGTRRASISSAPSWTSGRDGTATGTCGSPRRATTGRRRRLPSSPSTRCSSGVWGACSAASTSSRGCSSRLPRAPRPSSCSTGSSSRAWAAATHGAPCCTSRSSRPRSSSAPSTASRSSYSSPSPSSCSRSAAGSGGRRSSRVSRS